MKKQKPLSNSFIAKIGLKKRRILIDSDSDSEFDLTNEQAKIEEDVLQMEENESEQNPKKKFTIGKYVNVFLNVYFSSEPTKFLCAV